jgi:hypothetical protein
MKRDILGALRGSSCVLAIRARGGVDHTSYRNWTVLLNAGQGPTGEPIME